ncbi:MAG: hypothetical protein C5B54_05055 [Acidobacteria bacterium]|nr:MAG: hypothetical protein C5B54_05055 [Acidobacteriota bacterium]
MTRPFLRAEWRHLAMINYEIDPRILGPYVPPGTELDDWNGKAYVSVVGFLFLNTRVFGIPIPFHRNFEEVNLRLYVRRKAENEWRRGVVFIKEIVPRFAIAAVARTVYNEKYVSLPMQHRIERNSSFEYTWRFCQRWNFLRVSVRGAPQIMEPGSQEEFIAEHYWGYTAQRAGGTLEYQVEHPPWKIQIVSESKIDIEIAQLYGKEFVETLSAKPVSAFLADGSQVTVYNGKRI